MFGPDKHLEETPEILAALTEVHDRVLRIKVPFTGLVMDHDITIMPSFRGSMNGYSIEVGGRRAYTEGLDETLYADPKLIFGRVLPALRRAMVLDDMADVSQSDA